MPKCFIKSQVELPEGLSAYHVVFEADDGHQEEQQYQCTEDELKDALTHFNEERIKSVHKSFVISSPTDDRVITVKASKEISDLLKEIKQVTVAAEEVSEE